MGRSSRSIGKGSTANQMCYEVIFLLFVYVILVLVIQCCVRIILNTLCHINVARAEVSLLSYQLWERITWNWNLRISWHCPLNKSPKWDFQNRVIPRQGRSISCVSKHAHAIFLNSRYVTTDGHWWYNRCNINGSPKSRIILMRIVFIPTDPILQGASVSI